MEAKDTVMSEEERKVIPKGFHFLLEYKEELDWLLEAQVEITWQKAEEHFGTQNAIAFSSGVQTGKIEGKRAGIREALEWIKTNSYLVDPEAHSFVSDVAIWGGDWQAQLKAWGIK